MDGNDWGRRRDTYGAYTGISTYSHESRPVDRFCERAGRYTCEMPTTLVRPHVDIFTGINKAQS